jgi:hypothetical protein
MISCYTGVTTLAHSCTLCTCACSPAHSTCVYQACCCNSQLFTRRLYLLVTELLRDVIGLPKPATPSLERLQTYYLTQQDRTYEDDKGVKSTKKDGAWTAHPDRLRELGKIQNI